MKTLYNTNDSVLDYRSGGLDRYGSVVNHSWLNADKTAVPAVNHSEAWNFDKTGNWAEYSKNGMTETRTHNAANELQGIATHDANGNMTLMPGLKGKYDAWNRLVEVRNADDVVLATYEYNGLNQRIKKTIGGVLTKSFYNENWQEVESVTGSQMTSYVWGLRYVDDLVLREKGEERLYSLADPNWNVVALVDASGAVVERMKYDAFGKITWLDAAFGTKASSDYAWNRTFTGQVFDSETGLMLYRNRYFNVLQGRWISRDPIGYDGLDVNLYKYVKNMPCVLVDFSGEVWYKPWTWGGQKKKFMTALEALYTAAEYIVPGSEFTSALKCFDDCNTLGLIIAAIKTKLKTDGNNDLDSKEYKRWDRALKAVRDEYHRLNCG